MDYVDRRKAEIAQQPERLDKARRQHKTGLGDLEFIAGKLDELGLHNFAAGIRDAVKRLRER